MARYEDHFPDSDEKEDDLLEEELDIPDKETKPLHNPLDDEEEIAYYYSPRIAMPLKTAA